MKTLSLSILLIVITALNASAAPAKIGIITDMSGPMAFWGQQTRLGAEIARDELAAQGRDLVLVFGDHQLQPKNAVSEAQKMINIDKVDAIFSDFTGPSIAAAPLAREAGVLFLYSAVAVSALSANPDAFKTFLDYRLACRIVTDYWKNNGIQRIGMLKPNTEFGELCLRGAQAADENVSFEAFDPGDEVRTQILALKARKVQAIINPGYEPDHLRMFKALQSYQYFPLISMQEDDISPASKNAYPELMKLATFFGFESVSPRLHEILIERGGALSLHSEVPAGLSYLQHWADLQRALQLPARGR